MANRKREGKEGLRAKGKGQNRKALIGKVSRAPPPPVSPAPHCAPFFFQTHARYPDPLPNPTDLWAMPFQSRLEFSKGKQGQAQAKLTDVSAGHRLLKDSLAGGAEESSAVPSF